MSCLECNSDDNDLTWLSSYCCESSQLVNLDVICLFNSHRCLNLQILLNIHGLMLMVSGLRVEASCSYGVCKVGLSVALGGSAPERVAYVSQVHLSCSSLFPMRSFCYASATIHSLHQTPV